MGGFDSLLLMVVMLKNSSESRKSCSVRSKGALQCLFNEEGGWVIVSLGTPENSAIQKLSIIFIVGWEWGGTPAGESKCFTYLQAVHT